MYGIREIQTTISALREIQQAGMTLAEATRLLHRKENVPFDDIWPAIMHTCQISEKEAMQLTKEWCVLWKNRDEY